ncbi:MAG: hypothetical protein JW810_07040 [Sedimentisphaerales bacterium]|nr:hypothetical protein [Sedimentisphaerales bacterium]
MNQEMLEILIGKYLDSEITPAEETLLEQELQRNPAARELLQQYQQMHEQAQLVLRQEIAGGPDAQTIYQRALSGQQQGRRGSSRPWSRILALLRQGLPGRPAHPAWLQTAATLAAGLFLGFSLFLWWGQTGHRNAFVPPENQQAGERTAAAGPDETLADPPADQTVGRKIVELIPPTRRDGAGRYDYYIYTDPQGARYLLETPSSKAVRQASYAGDL